MYFGLNFKASICHLCDQIYYQMYDVHGSTNDWTFPMFILIKLWCEGSLLFPYEVIAKLWDARMNRAS